ncbi:MAG: MerR family transcriptional regulator [Anaerolineae bacterium]|nr:MerR family transcriptional regulator [Anaerolineae bacterium]
MNTLRIGQLAQQTGVTIETIRYYERRNLIPEPARLASGYRQYSLDDVARIRFIKRAQGLGFSLTEIADLLALRVNSEVVCNEVQKQAELKIADIEAKIEMLQHMKAVLSDLVKGCRENQFTDECPMLAALDTS